jgi:hypothetical protein
VTKSEPVFTSRTQSCSSRGAQTPLLILFENLQQ